MIIWLIAIILSGTFLGSSCSGDWIEYVDPWLTSEKLPTCEENQVQIHASNNEYAFWVAVLDNTTMESQTDIDTTYVVGSIQVFFDKKIIYQ